MRKLTVVLLLAGLAYIQGCVGPEGPPGVPGIPGQDGVTTLSEVFEVEIDFTAQNDYSERFDFTPPIFADDVVLAFLEWEEEAGNSVWRPLPQVVILEPGILQYNFDFSSLDFRIFLDTTFDPTTLDGSWTNNQVFRIVILPGEFANARLDLTDYEGIMNLINATEDDVVKLSPKK